MGIDMHQCVSTISSVPNLEGTHQGGSVRALAQSVRIENASNTMHMKIHQTETKMGPSRYKLSLAKE